MKMYIPTLLILGFAFCISSCEKSNSTPEYFKVKINGTWKTFNIRLSNFSQDVLDAYNYDLGIFGFENAEDTSESFSFLIRSDDQISNGKYSSDDPHYSVEMHYDKYSNIDIVSYGISNAANRPDSKFTITITAVTENEIRGTFTGNYLTDPRTGDVYEVTEGEFVAPHEN